MNKQTDWRQDFFDFSANAPGRLQLIIEGEIDKGYSVFMNVWTHKGWQDVAEEFGEDLDGAMENLFIHIKELGAKQ